MDNYPKIIPVGIGKHAVVTHKKHLTLLVIFTILIHCTLHYKDCAADLKSRSQTLNFVHF